MSARARSRPDRGARAFERRPSGEDAEAQVAPAGDRLLQQRGLPVAGPAPEHERVVPLGDRPKEPVDSRELRVASDDGRHYSTES